MKYAIVSVNQIFEFLTLKRQCAKFHSHISIFPKAIHKFQQQHLNFNIPYYFYFNFWTNKHGVEFCKDHLGAPEHLALILARTLIRCSN